AAGRFNVRHTAVGSVAPVLLGAALVVPLAPAWAAHRRPPDPLAAPAPTRALEAPELVSPPAAPRSAASAAAPAALSVAASAAGAVAASTGGPTAVSTGGSSRPPKAPGGVAVAGGNPLRTVAVGRRPHQPAPTRPPGTGPPSAGAFPTGVPPTPAFWN